MGTAGLGAGATCSAGATAKPNCTYKEATSGVEQSTTVLSGRMVSSCSVWATISFRVKAAKFAVWP